ncbi:dihydrodipicolinate synthase family protein [Geminicoccaceae bacterium 1502E]|nr:dihydrodipicolinate synthase family protein [Geminicoccaceae bacterium 1502E]
MKISPVTPADLARCVLSVPPLALGADLSLAAEENRKLVRHIEEGGVSTLLYGGNANLQAWPVGRLVELLEHIEAIAAPDSWVIPSVGPDYGRLIDSAPLARETAFPCFMALPMTAHHTPSGVERALRDFVQASGKPLIAYIRAENYLAPDALARMVESGEVVGVKYAVMRPDLTQDPYLAVLCDAVGRERIVSGAGEVPAVPHLTAFGLGGFTAGCVCIAPRLSMKVHGALKAGDMAAVEKWLEPIRPLEALRESISPIRVLHDAVTFSGVADMGPISPALANLEEAHRAPVAEAARALLAAERALAGQACAA